jgi:hypothetical protein
MRAGVISRAFVYFSDVSNIDQRLLPALACEKPAESLTPWSRGWAETWPDQPENQTCRSVRYLCQWERLALFVGDGGIELLAVPLS